MVKYLLPIVTFFFVKLLPLLFFFLSLYHLVMVKVVGLINHRLKLSLLIHLVEEHILILLVSKHGILWKLRWWSQGWVGKILKTRILGKLNLWLWLRSWLYYERNWRSKIKHLAILIWKKKTYSIVIFENSYFWCSRDVKGKAIKVLRLC